MTRLKTFVDEKGVVLFWKRVDGSPATVTEKGGRFQGKYQRTRDGNETVYQLGGDAL